MKLLGGIVFFFFFSVFFVAAAFFIPCQQENDCLLSLGSDEYNCIERECEKDSVSALSLEEDLGEDSSYSFIQENESRENLQFAPKKESSWLREFIDFLLYL